ncbi:MAG: 50S ribosomal protein L23 [Clostridia bacterium]|nr:50S ribosomal protein L23 [Clostridia bacterium]
MRNLSDIILKPVITEKAMDMISAKRYVFKVAKDANKPEIAAAVEAMFEGVKVADVNVITMKKKPKRLGVHAGYTGEWKKAIVTLTEDSKSIAFFESLS